MSEGRVCLLSIAVLLSGLGCVKRRPACPVVELGAFVPVEIEPGEGPTRVRDYAVPSTMDFVFRIRHMKTTLNVGFGYANRTGEDLDFSLDVVFFDAQKREMCGVSYSTFGKPVVAKAGSTFEVIGLEQGDVSCSAERARRIAFMKVSYSEKPASR